MIRCVPCILLISLSFPAKAQDRQALEGFITEAMIGSNVPGLSIAVIEHGEIAWERGFGVKNTASGEKVDPNTVFEAASLSKPIFAYAVLKLVDRGVIDLDVPLFQYVPGYIDDPRIRTVTARQVLSHTSGLPNWRPRDKPLAFAFEPVTRFSYSGEGFVYLQTVVEHLAGMPLDAFVRNEVFQPLGMTNSSYVWRDSYERLAATGHQSNGDPVPKYKPVEGGSPINGGGGPSAASSLHSTATDYAKFMLALMKGSAMLTTQVHVDASCANCVGKPVTHPSESISWGLGVGLEQTPQGIAFWPWGENSYFRCFQIGLPKEGRGVVIFTNSENGFKAIPKIVDRTMDQSQPAFDWLHYR
ncbi:MAG: serine hydrolase domain-containing protein [Bryobacteraceae bacterium]|jgi:CubicO group peptidase (beta-lactamase class C family)